MRVIHDCVQTCQSGYTDMGLTCTRNTYPFDTYAQTDYSYGYDYDIPQTDLGLTHF